MQKAAAYKEALAANGIFYRIYGEEHPDPPLIMIMGYGGSMFAWPLRFISGLAEKHKVIIFDNRGTGRSCGLSEGKELRIRHFAEDLKDLLTDLGYSSANLFGYSMGGCVALEFAHLFPEQARNIILESSTAGGTLYTGSDQDVKERLANPRGSNFDEMLFDFFDLCMSTQSIEANRTVLEEICANARPYATSLMVLQLQLKAFRHFDSSEYAGNLAQKFLIIHGKNDRILKFRNGEKLAETIPDARKRFLTNCGHCPHIEYESELLLETSEFLRSC